ncbi:MAG: hypothetical protein JWP60_4787 [Ramlibacter sp.]|nr:hypothetical protein [Ramlibacter sp.]
MDQPFQADRGRACGIESAIGRRAKRCSSWHLAACAVTIMLPGLAQAHVRWFSQVAADNVAPQALTTLLTSPFFVALLLLALVVVGGVRGIDVRLAEGNSRLMHLLRRIDSRMSQAAAPVLRIGCALFFAAIAIYYRDQPITLTPELKSPTSWVLPLQLAIAAGMLFRAGVIPACAGVVLLYLYSAHVYGIVHLMDYQLFLGVCVFLSLDRLSQRHGAADGLLVLRLMVATSFLWVGIEKWLYPEWTCDILRNQLPTLAMGLAPNFWAMAAGFIEVALAFLMLFGGVSSQVAAAVLFFMLVAAIPAVGAVDAIGHLPMLFPLFILATTRNRLPRRLPEHAAWQAIDLCSLFLMAVTGMTGLYFLTHELASAAHVQVVTIWPDLAVATLASAALAAWVLRAVRQNRPARPRP